MSLHGIYLSNRLADVNDAAGFRGDVKMVIARGHKSIIDAAAEADKELNALLNATTKGEATSEAKPDAPVVPEVKAKENVNTETDVEKKADAGEVKPDVKPVEEKKEVIKQEDNIWHERFKEINGKYLAEVPRLAADKRELKKDIARLEEQVRVLTEQIASASGNGKETHSQDAEINELLDTFGEEGSQKINAYLDKRVRALESRFESKLKPVETGIESIKTGQAVTAKQRYIENLDRLVPAWRKYDIDSGFRKWLDENTAKYSGQSFRQILTEADLQMNAATVAEMILDYENSIAPLKAASNDTKQKELEKLVVPAKVGGSGSVPKGNETEKISIKVIEKFYDDIKHGKFKGSEQDKKRLETLYDQALYEHRVTP